VNKTTIWILTPSFSFHIWKKNIFKISQYEKRQRWLLLLKNKHHNDVKFKQRDANLRWLLIHLSKVNYFLTAYHTVNINSYKPKKKKTFNQVWKIAEKTNISWNFMFRYFHPQKSQKWTRENIYQIARFKIVFEHLLTVFSMV
jgi:hypothetical protein